jgi:nucleoside-diphosphate-sugar epimerase
MIDILVTGANGFLGRSIVGEVSQSNSVITLGTSTTNDIICDLANNIPQFSFNIDLVIHVAGKAHSVPISQGEKDSFFKINVNGTSNLLKALSNSFLPKQFVFISSVSVYGLQNGINIDENSKLIAVDPYGLSKIKAEQMILDWCIKNNVICTILRLPLVVGANPPGNLNIMINGIKKGYYFNIAEGKARKSMVLIGDVASSILKVAGIGGIYNLTDGYHPTFAELSIFFSNQLGKNNPPNVPFWIAKFISLLGEFIGEKSPINLNKLKKITSELTFDDSKARKAFGWDPTPVLSGFKIN